MWLSGQFKLGLLLFLTATVLFAACADTGSAPSEAAAIPDAQNNLAAGAPADDCAVNPANVLKNPSFEEGTGGWIWASSDETGSFSVSGPAYACNFAARLDFSNSTDATRLRQKGFSLQPNTNYVLSFAAKSSSGNDMAVFMERNDGSTNYGVMARPKLTPEWKPFSFPFTTGDDISDPQVRFGFAGIAQAGDVYWIDDVSIAPVGG